MLPRDATFSICVSQMKIFMQANLFATKSYAIALFLCLFFCLRDWKNDFRISCASVSRIPAYTSVA